MPAADGVGAGSTALALAVVWGVGAGLLVGTGWLVGTALVVLDSAKLKSVVCPVCVS